MDDYANQIASDSQRKESSPELDSAPVPLVRRACENCRLRKIRCDRNIPCSHCAQVNIPCTHAPPKPKPKRTRIHLSSQHERKIDIIDHRLEEVTQLLRKLQTSDQQRPARLSVPRSHNSPQGSTQYQHSMGVSTPFGQASQIATDSPIVEGEPSLATHSSFASDYLRQAIRTRTGSLQDPSLDMGEILDSLHHMVQGLKRQATATEAPYPHARVGTRPSLQDCQLPPIEKTVALINSVMIDKTGTNAWIHALCPMERFSHLVLRVYFSKTFSEAEFIIANAGLMWLLQEQAYHVPEQMEEANSFAQLCSVNLERGLLNLPLHLPANSTMIFALVLGAFYAIEISKPSLCWTLVAKAAELCYSLGYHRLSAKISQDYSDERDHQLLFWCVYFLDKSLSLRLGRASSISDWDITVTELTPEDANFNPFLEILVVSVRTAQCQGKIYEQLYSPDAVCQPEDVRRARVEELAKRLNEIRAETAEINAHWVDKSSGKISSEFATFCAISDDVIRLSLLTLVYRASPTAPESSMPFVPECIEAARATLKRHQDCLATIGSVHSVHFPSYVHWTLLFAPFIPFIVLFCHVIDTQDKEDLEHLRCFITSVESAPAVSDAATKALQLFQVLYNVAIRYTASHVSTPATDQAQASLELDAYMAELGLPVPLHHRHHQHIDLNSVQPGSGELGPQIDNMLDGLNGRRASDRGAWMGSATQLEDWLNSNYQMMDLIEEPSFNFNLQTWGEDDGSQRR